MNAPDRPSGDNQRDPRQGGNAGPGGPGQPPTGSPSPFNGQMLLWLVMGVLLVGWLIFAVIAPNFGGNGMSISYSYMLQQAKIGNVTKVTFNDTQITGTFRQVTHSDKDSSKSGTTFNTYVPNVGTENPTPELITDGVRVEGTAPSGSGTGGFIGSLLIPLLPPQ